MTDAPAAELPDRWRRRWSLVADGAAVRTATSLLYPVTRDGISALLKVPSDDDERRGGKLMAWWDGNGAAPVLAHEDGVVLLARAAGGRDLLDWSRSGRDDEACRLLCAVAARLHARRPGAAPDLVPLATWFDALRPAARGVGGPLRGAADAADMLLAAPRDVVVLHGDLHGGNALDFGAAAGFLAIDPKALHGERGFDFANLFTNPDLADPSRPVAVDPDRFARRLDVVTEAAGVERSRLLLWILAWTGLSAAWFLADGRRPTVQFRVAGLAAAALGR